MWDLILHYGLLLGGIFQLICILAIVVVRSNKRYDEEDVFKTKEEMTRKFQGQSSYQPQTRLRERKKKK